MLVRRPTARRRGGVTIVEAALLLSIFLMFLFGVFEYCRYVMVLQVAGNAARDGARYATVNLDKPDNFDFVDSTTPAKTNVRTYTRNKMAHIGNMLEGMTINTFPCDTNSLYGYTNGTATTAQPKTGYVRPGMTATSVTRTVQWRDATFTEKIAVEITGTYKPMFPVLLKLAPSSDVTIVAVLGSEG